MAAHLTEPLGLRSPPLRECRDGIKVCKESRPSSAPEVASRRAEFVQRLYGRRPSFYLVFCVPFGVVYCFLVPPMLVPDEWAHFSRAVQIAYGDVIGEQPKGDRPGGQVPPSLRLFLTDPRFARLRATKKKTPIPPVTQEPKRISQLIFEDETVFATCPFVRYPPSSYLFGSAAVRLGRAFRCDAVSTFYSARLFTFVASAFMVWLALCWISSGRLFAFLTLSTPMMLSLSGSCSQDAALISYTAAAVGFVQRFLQPTALVACPARSSRLLWPTLLAAGAVGAVVAGRPPYLPLAGIVPLFFLAATRRWREAGIVACVAVATPACWLWLTSHLNNGNEFQADRAGQIRFILERPGESLAVFFRSVWQYVASLSYVRGLVAETANGGPLPPWLYRTVSVALLLALIRDAWLSKNDAARSSKLATLIIVCSAYCLLHVAAYIYFTPVGADVVRGFQGRYLAPLLLTLTLVVGVPRGETQIAVIPSLLSLTLDAGVLMVTCGIVVFLNVWSAISILRTFYYP